jgi:HEAT repeat protein
VLRPLLADADWRQRAALALGHLRDPLAAPALLELLHHIRVDWRRRAVHYLGHVGDAAAAHTLLALAADDAKVRNEAYEAAARITTRLYAPDATPILSLLAAAREAETLLDARQRLDAALASAARDRAHALLPARALY